MPLKCNFLLKERTFLQFDIELMPKKRKHCLQVLEVVFNGLGEDEDIIQIDYHEGI